MTFFDYNSFFLLTNKIIRLHINAKRTLCKDADFAAIYNFSVNSYQTSAKVKSIPYHFSFFVLTLNITRPDVLQLANKIQNYDLEA